VDSATIVAVLKKSFNLLLQDIVPLLVAGLILGVLTPLTLGILGGPLMAGLYRMIVLRIREGRVPEIGDVFYFERFGSFVGAFYVLAIAIGFGFFLLVVPGVYLLTIWFYVFALMVERELGLTQAMSESKAIVDKVGLGTQFALVVVILLIGAALSTLTRGLGGLVFTPFFAIYVIVALRHLTGEEPIVGAGSGEDSSPPTSTP
jgi:hypothetical protein